jgi:hypothetical protein
MRPCSDFATRYQRSLRRLVNALGSDAQSGIDHMPTCIYCSETKNSGDFVKREHVLPQSFGTFENNLTLIGAVCDACNGFFGEDLELALARDTPDGLERYFKGGKSPDEYRSLGRRSSMTFWIDRGIFQGAQVVQHPIDGEMRVKPLPQVGLSVKGEAPIEWFRLGSLPPKEIFIALFEAGRRHVQFLNVVDLAAAISELRAIGLEFEQAPASAELGPLGVARIEWRVTLDDRAARVLTKIALNYLTFLCGSEFALRTEFTPARRYARYGETMPMKNWRFEDSPLVNGSKDLAAGHGLALSLHPGGPVGVQISFHNSRCHRVGLAQRCAVISNAEHVGHFFNCETWKVFRIEPDTRSR